MVRIILARHGESRLKIFSEKRREKAFLFVSFSFLWYNKRRDLFLGRSDFRREKDGTETGEKI